MVSVNTRAFQLRAYHIVGILLVLMSLLYLWWLRCEAQEKVAVLNSVDKRNRVVKFSNKVVKYKYFRNVCYLGRDPESIKDLFFFISMLKSRSKLCSHQYKVFHSIYKIRSKIAHVILPDVIKSGIDSKFIERTQNQLLIYINNVYSLEGAVFNLARMAMPPVWGQVMEHVRKTVDAAREGCDFCAVANNTATDTFGRLESRHTVIVSNAFKIEKYHGLAILKRHHALMWNEEQFIDCMALILRWFKLVHHVSPDDVYRIIYWDLLLKSGVSQMHPHMHLILGNHKYLGKWDELHNAGLLFEKEHSGSNYWTDLLQLYTSLGLSASFGNASVMAYLTPKRDYEVIVISEQPCLDFFRLVFFTLRAFIDDLGEPSVCMSYVFPKLNSNSQYSSEMPMLFKLVSRGDPVSLQSDISSFDLYGTPNINRDPYKVIKVIRESLEKIAKQKFYFPQWND